MDPISIVERGGTRKAALAEGSIFGRLKKKKKKERNKKKKRKKNNKRDRIGGKNDTKEEKGKHKAT